MIIKQIYRPQQIESKEHEQSVSDYMLEQLKELPDNEVVMLEVEPGLKCLAFNYTYRPDVVNMKHQFMIWITDGDTDRNYGNREVLSKSNIVRFENCIDGKKYLSSMFICESVPETSLFIPSIKPPMNSSGVTYYRNLLIGKEFDTSLFMIDLHCMKWDRPSNGEKSLLYRRMAGDLVDDTRFSVLDNAIHILSTAMHSSIKRIFPSELDQAIFSSCADGNFYEFLQSLEPEQLARYIKFTTYPI